MTKISVCAGDKYGRLTIVEELPKHTQPSGQKVRKFACVCNCGKPVEATLGNLRSGHTRSCGCVAGTHRQSRSAPEYHVWRAMRQRCSKPSDPHYSRYGGRGIKVCEQWNSSYETFIADMGPRPSSAHTLERMDNDKGYCPENCKWATRQEQQGNRSTNILLTHNGRTQCVAAWARELGKSKSTLLGQVKRLGTDNVLKLYLG